MPRRRDEDDDIDDDLPVRRKSELSGLDAMFANTSMPVLILFGCCCGIVAFVLSLVAVLTCKDETAKKNAMIVLIVSGILTFLGAISSIIQMMAGGAGRAGGF